MLVFLSHRYFSRLRQFIHFVGDVVAEVGDVPLIGPEIQQVKDGAGRRFYHYLTSLGTGGRHLHLHIFREWRYPHSMTCLDDKQIVVAFHAAELCPLLKQPFNRCVGSSGIVGKFKGCFFHFLESYHSLKSCHQKHTRKVILQKYKQKDR